MKFSTINEWLFSGGLTFTLMIVVQGAVVIAINDMWQGKQPVSSASKPDAVPFPLLHAMTRAQFKELAALELVVGLALTLVGFVFVWLLLALAQPI
jgi:hypothetical protein